VEDGQLRASVVGEITEREGTLRITRIRVRYQIEIPAAKRAEADRALKAHVAHCPVAQTLLPCVEIDWEASITEK